MRAPVAEDETEDSLSELAMPPVHEVHAEGTPLYRKIHGYLCAQIESGKLRIGDKLPSERTLAKAFRVSLMTARHALSQMELDGKVERRRAAGSFVRTPQIQFNKLEGFTQQLAARGIKTHSVIKSLRTIRAEDEIAARLALPTNAPIIRLERLRLGGDEPMALETCYFAVKESVPIRRADFTKPNLFRVLEEVCGAEPKYADEEIDATSADVRARALLKLPPEGPLLRARQTLFSNTGKPLAFSLILYRSDRVSISVRRFR